MKRIGVSMICFKVKGFTVMEAIIALALTGLLSLLVFAGLRYYHRLFINIQAVGYAQTEINLFQQSLQNDASMAERIIFDNDVIFSVPSGVVVYRFTDKGIIRNSDLSTDTFKIKCLQPEIIWSNNMSDLVGGISIICFNSDMEFPVSIIKEYPPGLQTENDDYVD